MLPLGDPVACARLADMVNRGLRHYPDPANFKKMQDKYLRPANVPHLQIPQMHEAVHHDLSFRATELAMRKAQVVSPLPFLLFTVSQVIGCISLLGVLQQ
jgi:hypothetical protein